MTNPDASDVTPILDPVKARMLGIAQFLTQPMAEQHDEALFGLVAKAGPPPVAPTQGKIFRATVLELPKHFIVQLRRTVLPLTGLISAFALGALALRAIKEASAFDRGAGMELYATLSWYSTRSPLHWALATFLVHIAGFGWALLFLLPLLCMWNPKATHPYVLNTVLIDVVANVLIAVSFFCSYLSFGDDFAPEPVWAVALWLLTFMVIINSIWLPRHVLYTFKALTSVNNQEWTWIYTIYCLSTYVLMLLYDFLLRFLMGMDDFMKLGFVILVNAPLMEVLSVMSRFSARSVRNNHPSTSWMPICLGVVFKKSFMRFVVGTMKSASLVTGASVLSGVLEILARVTMPTRDKWTYRKLFGSYLPPDQNHLALMTNVRSRSLRAETESLEGITDLSFIVMGIAWPFLYSASLDGKTLPSFQALVLKGLIQWGMEAFLDVTICIYLAVVQNYHILSHGKTKCPYWSGIVGALTLSLSGVLGVHTLGFVLCTKPPMPDGVDWVFCATLYD